MSSGRRGQFVEHAKACLKNDQIDDAISFAQQAVDIDAADAEAQNVLGAALSRADIYAAAGEAFNAAISLAPGVAKYRYNLASHHYRTGDKTTAKQIALEALGADPSHAASRNLVKRIESERTSLPTIDPGLRASAVPPSAPPVLGMAPPPQVFMPSFLPRPRHSIAAIARWGKNWEAVVWLAYFFNTLATFVLFSTGAATDLLSGYGETSSAVTIFVLLVWVGFAVVWIVDMIDRQPAGQYVALGVLGLFLGLPCLSECYGPIVAIILFPLYVLGTRTDKARID